MKLDEILKLITPLPWASNVPARNVSKLIGDNKTYAHHAANVLPGLVRASKMAQAALLDAGCKSAADHLQGNIHAAEKMTTDARLQRNWKEKMKSKSQIKNQAILNLLKAAEAHEFLAKTYREMEWGGVDADEIETKAKEFRDLARSLKDGSTKI